ncbi:MAG: SpoIIE family protein phosphatase [Selenomonadaceae bacterium]|nr:SpoIIE family protein phosphatase [Selenomonadaceae bacterium]
MNFNIKKKVLFLVLGAGLVTFCVLSVFAIYERTLVREDMKIMSEELGNKSAEYINDLLIKQLKYTLQEVAEAHAQFIDRQMSITCEDVEILANFMTEIFSHPENYKPQTIKDPRYDTIGMGEPYIVYAPDLRDNVTPEVQEEIALAANGKDLIERIAQNYEGYNATVFFASENGWHVCSRILLGEDGKNHFDTDINFSHERIYEYDPRQRPWYKDAKRENKPVISDLYRTIETDGYQQIGASAPYYDANGKLIGVVGVDTSNVDLYNWISEVNSNNGEYMSFVLNNRGEVIFSTEKEGILSVQKSDMLTVATKSVDMDLRKSAENSVAETATKMVNGETGVEKIIVDDEIFYLAFAPMPDTGWSFGMVISEEEILSKTSETQTYFLDQIYNLQTKMVSEHNHADILSYVIPVILLIILFFLSNNLSRRFVKPIHELSDGVREIAQGNLDKKLDIKTSDEIEHLAICFNAMTDELQTYMKNLTKETAEKERIATELDVAKDIQNGMLPKDFDVDKRADLFATMTPAKEVGGDFYDFYMLDETHLAITVADVSGKGIPAALFMVISKTILNNFAASFYKLNGIAPVVAATNEQLCANNDAMMFVTAFIGVLNLETGEFSYVNAGHNPPVIYHAEENHCDFLDVKKNLVLGPIDGVPFVEQKITFKRGDLIFLYTDGVTEALNVKDEEYLPDRLIAFMNKTDCRADLHDLLKNIHDDVADHVGGAEQSDDITMFALRFKG